MSEWKPIESAPIGEPGIDVGSKNPSEWFLATNGVVSDVIQRKGAPGEFSYEFHNHGDVWYGENYFTHWMPIPAIPNASDVEVSSERKGI